MRDNLYPLKFTPISKERIWGGTKLKSELNKDSQLESIGESWEISDVEGDVSIISNGKLKNTSLKTLIQKYKADVVGKKNYKLFGDKFPLLIKFIDAKEDLSIQLHPDDKLAKERHNSFGKNEMWYVMQADKDSNLIIGFNREMNSKEYLKHLEDKSLTEILSFEKVIAGDTFFIEAGRVHAIGAGVMLAEIQQTSDITYRLYDWDRIDNFGNERELHNDLALEAINFNMPDNFKVNYSKVLNQSNEMVSCKYFKTNYLALNTDFKIDNLKDSFIIYVCIDGEVYIQYRKEEVKLTRGETLLIPAVIKEYKLVTNYAKLLEVYV